MLGGSRAQKVRFWGSPRSIRCKQANFRGLIAIIGHYRPILTTRPHTKIKSRENLILRKLINSFKVVKSQRMRLPIKIKQNRNKYR